MREVCKDVTIEPGLIPTVAERVEGITADGARLDVPARGVWSTYERTFFDVVVALPFYSIRPISCGHFTFSNIFCVSGFKRLGTFSHGFITSLALLSKPYGFDFIALFRNHNM